MKLINYKNSSFIIFIAIAIWYAAGNFIWWYLNAPIFPYKSAVYSQYLMNAMSDKFFFVDAPLIFWIIKLMFYLFGKTYFDLQIIFVNYIFFLVGLFFMYKLCCNLKNNVAGNIAMSLFALVPAIYGLSRIYSNYVYHFTLITIVNIYCLIKLDNFKNRKWTFLYGITVGVGLLIKDAFCVFFFTSWLYVVIRSLAEKTDSKKIINILITILLGVLISCCHYFDEFIIQKMLNDPIDERAPIFCFDSLKVLTIGLGEYIVSPLFFLIFLVALYWFILKYKNKNKLIIVLWFLVPWLIMMFMPHMKFQSYGVPFVPIIILMISMFLSSIRKVIVRKLIVYVLLFVGVVQYIDFSYGILNIDLFDKDIKIFNKYQIKYYDKDLFFEYDVEQIKKYIILINSLKEYKDCIIIKPESVNAVLLCMGKINNLTIIEDFFRFKLDCEDESYELIDNKIQNKKYIFLDLDSENKKLYDKVSEIAEKKYWLFSHLIKVSRETYIEENIKYLLNFYDKLNNYMYVSKMIYISPDEIYKIYKSKQ